MKLFIKNIVKKQNMFFYGLFFLLMLVILVYCVFNINYLDKYDNDRLNNRDNLLIELEDYHNLNVLKDIKKKIKYLYVVDDNYYQDFAIDYNNLNKLKDNEAILYAPSKINVNGYILKDYYKSENTEIVVNASNFQDKEYLYVILAKDFKSKISIINYLNDKGIGANNNITYESNNASATYKTTFKILSFFLLILTTIMIYLFNKDDYKLNNMLRIMGYRKIKLLFINYGVVTLLLTGLYVISIIGVTIFSLIVKYALDIGSLIISLSLLYLILMIIVFIIYILFYTISYKKYKYRD